MKRTTPFVLVPAVGDDARDILRDFDGQGERVRLDTATCQVALRQGARPMLQTRSAYEPVPQPEHDCLALQAAAREGIRLGYREMAQVLTCPEVGQRQQMALELADSLVPRAPGPRPLPASPHHGMN